MVVAKANNSLKIWHYLVLALAAFACLFPGIAALPVIDRDEGRFVQASKQMLETGDYVDIRFQDESRYKKPIGIYWLQTAAVHLTGGDAASDVWRYRLVSVAAGIAATLLIALLGSRMFGANAGLAAGIMLAGLLGLAFEARIAKTDATLLAVTLLAQTALAHIYLAAKDGVLRNARWAYVLWAAIGVGVLIKGPLTLLIVGLTIAGLAFFDKDRAWMAQLRPITGLAILTAIALPWLLAITIKSDGAFWAESVGKDMLGKVSSGQESHWGPPGYYILTYSLYMWPFGYFAILGALKALNVWREPRILFCLAWYLPFWLMLEILPTKLPHYPLPVYPALLLLAGWALVGAGQTVPLQKWQKWLSWSAAFGVAVVTLLLATISIAIIPWSNDHISWLGIIAALIALCAGFLASNLHTLPRDLKLLAFTSFAATAFFGVTFTAVLPQANALWVSHMVGQKLKSVEGCANPQLASVDFHEPSLVFLAGTKTNLTDLAGAVAHLKSADPCAVALMPADKITELQAMLGSDQKLTELDAISGINYSKGSEVSLILVRLAR